MREKIAYVPAVSIIIPVKAINQHIHESIPRILELEYPNFEILILPDYASEEVFPKIRIIPTGPMGPAEKRDLALRHAKGEILAFLDDDAFPRQDWLLNATRHFADPHVGAVGGPAVTPESDNLWQRASGAVYASWLASGEYAYRYVPKQMRTVEDFPSVNLLIRRDLFEQIGGFDTNYWPGEDTKLCLDLIRLGKKIIYDPDVFVWHHRRPIFRKHLQQVARYGLHRGFFVKAFPGTSRRLSYFVPTTFVIGVVLGAPLSSAHWLFKDIYAIVLTIYSSALITCVLSVAIRERSVALGALTAAGVMATHVTYGLYFLRGLLVKGLKR